jgi:hypothetical protein
MTFNVGNVNNVDELMRVRNHKQKRGARVNSASSLKMELKFHFSLRE